MTKTKHLLIIAIVFSFSCQVETTVQSSIVPARIVFPKNQAIFKFDQMVSLQTDGSSPMSWFDNGSLLGKGRTLQILLPVGGHHISIQDQGTIVDQIDIVIEDSNPNLGLQVLSQYQGVIKVPIGPILPVVMNFADQIYPLKMVVAASPLGQVKGVEVPEDSSSLPKRTAVRPRLIYNVPPMGQNSRTIVVDKQFYFPNLSDEGKSGAVISATLIAESGRYQVWLDRSALISADHLTEFTTKLTTFVLPRTEALWGVPWVAKGNDQVRLLLTPKLNENGQIIGFFNPADCFPSNDDSKSPDYNPGSNEAKILYLGLPDPTSKNYSFESILATAAHEYQHLIHFFAKTYDLASLGNYSQFREAVFLDEGLSHLTENLVGLGASGGNFSFCAYYLRHPEDISLLFSDRSGESDNAGIRGAICLYLSWLFDQSGGGSWDEKEPLLFHDGGGLKLLRRLSTVKSVGVDALSEVIAMPWSESLRLWAGWLNQSHFSGEVKVDPFTEEVNFIDPYMGTGNFGSSSQYTFAGPKRLPFVGSLALLPYSVTFFERQNSTSLQNYTYNGSATLGPCYFVWQRDQ